MAGRAAAFLFTFCIPIVLVRTYSLKQYGQFQQLMLLFHTFHPILQLGISHSILYFYPRNTARRKELLNQTFYFLVCVGFFFVVAVLAFGSHIVNYLGSPEIEVYLPWISVYVCCMIISTILELLLIVEEKSVRASQIIFLTGFGRFILLVGISYFYQEIGFLVGALMFISLVRVLVLVGYLVKNYGLCSTRVNWSFFRTQMDYALPFGIATVFVILNTWIDKFFVSAYYGPEVYAIYIVGCFQLPLVSLIFEPVVNVTIPKISQFHQDNALDKVHELWGRAAGSLSIIGLPLCIFAVVFARELITFLFTDKYESSVGIFVVFLFLIPRQITNYGVVLRAFGATRYILKAGLISFLVAAILMFPAIRFFGLYAPPVVVVSSLYLTAFLQLKRTKTVLKTTWIDLLPWPLMGKVILLAALCTMVAKVTVVVLALEAFPHLAFASILFCTMFWGLGVRFGLIDEKNRASLSDFFRRLNPRGSTIV